MIFGAVILITLSEAVLIVGEQFVGHAKTAVKLTELVVNKL